jgi:hypothetical protein
MRSEMTSHAIASLALLKVSREMGKDHLDTFLPMILEAIRITNGSVVSVTDLQVIVENQFGLNIPQNAIETILYKAKRHGYLTLGLAPLRQTHLRHATCSSPSLTSSNSAGLK